MAQLCRARYHRSRLQNTNALRREHSTVNTRIATDFTASMNFCRLDSMGRRASVDLSLALSYLTNVIHYILSARSLKRASPHARTIMPPISPLFSLKSYLSTVLEWQECEIHLQRNATHVACVMSAPPLSLSASGCVLSSHLCVPKHRKNNNIFHNLSHRHRYTLHTHEATNILWGFVRW